MNTPAADIDVDAGLVRRLIRAQHDDLAGPLTLIANGWDNVLYRLGDDLCVRLPRRRVAAELILNEQRWLPVLAGHVNVPIPVPVRTGVPSREYPWAWTITRWFEGRPAADVAVADRGAIAIALAEFMAGLHTPAPADAPVNPVRGVPLASRGGAVRQRLATGAIPRAGELRQIWEGLLAVPPRAGPPLWLHGDPHPANFLLAPGPDGRGMGLSAVLDFGDLTGGDPATDLAAAWLVFGPDDRAAFRAHLDRLTGTDPGTWQRARGWALSLGTAIAVNSGDNPRMAAIAGHALDQVLLEPGA